MKLELNQNEAILVNKALNALLMAGTDIPGASAILGLNERLVKEIENARETQAN